MWINRALAGKWDSQKTQPVRVLVGPRQSGKTSFLEKAANQARTVIRFDDLATRETAQRDPRVFLDQLGPKIILDECQYVPQLFPEIKRRVDRLKKARLEKKASKEALSYWMTGSNRLLLDQSVAESLTGRATYYRFYSLSVAELKPHFGSLSMGTLLFKGGWPELYADSELDPISYLNDHIQTTLEKDLVRTAGIIKVQEFLRVLRHLAGRVGTIFVASELGRDAGTKYETVSQWVSFIERMMYLIEVPAYSNSRITRLIKAPKYYFSDVSIAVRLQGWSTTEPLLVSPNIGYLFENLVASEIVKTKEAHLKSWELSHWRTKEQEEIDFILTHQNKTLAIECKVSAVEAARTTPPPGLKKLPQAKFIVVCSQPGVNSHSVISLEDLGSFLLDYFD